MSDKKLLEEGTIRRFMELANIKPIGNGLIEEGKKHEKKEEKKEMHGKKHSKKTPVKEGYAQEEESLEETYGMEEEGAKTHTTFGPQATQAEEGYMEEADMEGGEGEGGGDVRAALEQIKAGVDALLGMIEGSSGLEMAVEEEPEAEKDMGDMGAGEEEDEEESLEEKKAHKAGHEKGKKPPVEEAKHKKEEEEEEEEESLEETLDADALAEELTRRVSARLMAEMKKTKKGAAGSVAAASGKTGTHHAKPPKGHGPGKGTPFTGGKKKK